MTFLKLNTYNLATIAANFIFQCLFKVYLFNFQKEFIKKVFKNKTNPERNSEFNPIKLNFSCFLIIDVKVEVCYEQKKCLALQQQQQQQQ